LGQAILENIDNPDNTQQTSAIGTFFPTTGKNSKKITNWLAFGENGVIISSINKGPFLIGGPVSF